jgi:hypothetical protein
LNPSEPKGRRYRRISKPPIQVLAPSILFHLRVTTYSEYTILEAIGVLLKQCLRQLPLHRLPPDLPQIRSAQLLRCLIDGLGEGISKELRLKRVNRQQMILRAVDVERLIEPEHAARAIWKLVGGLDLSAFRAEIEVVEGEAGRPAYAPW